MRAFFIAVVCAGLVASCLPWDPRTDGPGDGGAAGGGGAGGNSAGAGGSAGAGALDAGPLDAGPLDAGPLDAGPIDAGPIDAGPIDAGLIDAGSTDAGLDAGASELPVPVLDAGSAGDYLRDGGCVPTPDGGARCHPWCRPGLGDAGKAPGTACCLDDECLSGECQGSIAASNRICVFQDPPLGVGAPCGDSTDCNVNIPTFCDVRTQRCAETFPSTLGDDGGLLATFPAVGGVTGSLVPSRTAFFCALPGTTVLLANAGNPCCYDRNDSGVVMSCLETGTCTCVPNGACNTTRDYTCPF